MGGPSPISRGSPGGLKDGAGAPAPAAATVAASPTAAEQAAPGQELWRGVIERLRKGRPALAAILAGSELIAEESGYLRVRLPGEGVAFQVAALESGENRPAVQKAIREVFGRSLGLKIDQAEAGADLSGPMQGKESTPAQPPRRRRGNLDDVQRIAEKMDGEILGPA